MLVDVGDVTDSAWRRRYGESAMVPARPKSMPWKNVVDVLREARTVMLMTGRFKVDVLGMVKMSPPPVMFTSKVRTRSSITVLPAMAIVKGEAYEQPSSIIGVLSAIVRGLTVGHAAEAKPTRPEGRVGISVANGVIPPPQAVQKLTANNSRAIIR